MTKLNAAVAFVVLISSLFAASQKQDEKTATDPRVRCSVTASSPVWTTPDTTVVNIELKNVSDEDIEIDASAELTLFPDKPGDDAGLDAFGASIDIRHNSPAAIVENPPGSILLLHPRFTLAKRSTATFAIHASNMKWDRLMSSQWPALPLKIVPAGQYHLQLQVETNKARILSNVAKVEIRRKS